MQSNTSALVPYDMTKFLQRGESAWNITSGSSQPYLGGAIYCHPEANSYQGDCGYMGSEYVDGGETVAGVQGASRAGGVVGSKGAAERRAAVGRTVDACVQRTSRRGCRATTRPWWSCTCSRPPEVARA